MSLALITTGLVLGLAGSPHCVAMCAAPCAAVERACPGARPWQAAVSLQLGRLLSYGSAGALVAVGAGWLAEMFQATAWLKPLWTLLQAAVMVFGLWLLLTGRIPRVALGRLTAPLSAVPMLGPLPAMGRVRQRGWAWSGAVGLLWAAWPCGLLYSALVVAALADGPLAGAAVMLAFALGGALALLLGRSLLGRLGRGAGAVRLAGVLLAAAGAWAMWHQLTGPGGPWCIAA
ncbi:sulfite exporter TauE/SafE family protein [Methylibium sp.]|uniref:sulfite exporter TauE/SafE family protein n=1 Tax=Methylibium sp. TaxID=2067992 RepID=UPI003D0E4320